MNHHILPYEQKSTVYQSICTDFKKIPKGIKIVAISLFIAFFGWGLGGDTYFSLYLKSVVDNIFWVSVFGAILSLGKLIFTLPVGDMEEKEKPAVLLFWGKIFYMLCGATYFLAGIFHSVPILIIALILNGIAMTSSYITSQTYVRKHATRKNRYLSAGLVFAAMNGGYVAGALISSLFIHKIQLSYVFLFVIVFSFLSLVVDFFVHREAKIKIRFHEYFNRHTIKRFLKKLFGETFSLTPYKKIFTVIKEYDHHMYGALGLQFLVNMLAYVGFLFIPIIAIKDNFTLGEVAILFAIMRSPYILDFFTTEVADRYNKKQLIGVVLLFLGCLFALLGIADNMYAIMIISFAGAFGIAIIMPIIIGLITKYVKPHHKGTITGAQEFVSRIGEMTGALVVGVLAAIIGLKTAFIVVGIGIFFIATRILFKRTKKVSK